MTTPIVDETGVVVTENVPVVEPAGIVMEAGAVAARLFVHRDAVIPPAGAGLSRVRVPVELTPPSTDAGFRESEDTFTGTRPRLV